MTRLRTLPLGLLFVWSFCIRSYVTRSITTELISYRTTISDSVSCQIYCYGPLLHIVQMSQIFADSKTFVDMKLKFPPEQTLAQFQKLLESKSDSPSKEDVQEFVSSHFDDLGKEFVEWMPDDWVEQPKFINDICDADLKQWALDLNEIWKQLGRKMTDDVHTNSQMYSIIPVENPVIIPGGRFLEFYYWDSYWIIRGLLYSEMTQTAKGMIKNFLSIVDRFGFIPNGGRIYYSGRSQPPLLIPMVRSYVEFTNDKQFAIESLGTLEHEFEYWTNNHTVQAKGMNMWTYNDRSTGPRPESYREDILAAEIFPTDEEKEQHYVETKAAAESGMDFSSRWFINEKGTNEGNLTNLKTRSIVPVELNAIAYKNAKIIAEIHGWAGNSEKQAEYETKAKNILEAIETVLWNEDLGVWLDYDLINDKPRNYFVPTNLSPLWMEAYNKAETPKISKLILNYIEQNKLDQYPGGVPNTLSHTGEQWDFPNVWPPMQYALIKGLENLGTPESIDLSKRWGVRWVKSGFEAYKDARAMFEKYNAEIFGGHGGGGEYEVQKGFGWTNGIILELLQKYGSDPGMVTGCNYDNLAASSKNILSAVAVTVVALIAATVGRYVW